VRLVADPLPQRPLIQGITKWKSVHSLPPI
jgi:hypothetical protein